MLIVILDSCRKDTYEKANTKIIDKAIGPAQKAMTHCNHTMGSFAHFMLMNDFPIPNNIPRETWAQRGGFKNKYFYTDNVHLERYLISPTAKAEWFDLYKVFKPAYDSTDEIIKYVALIDKKKLKEPHVIYLWFGQTHQPFFLDHKRVNGWMLYARRYKEYSMGEDCIPDTFFEDIKKVQVEIVEEILSKLWEGFLKDYKGEVIITADHGESCGEISPFDGNHKAGHGHDIHPVQFEVPMVHRRGR